MATGNVLLPILGAVGDSSVPPGMAFNTVGVPKLLFDDTTDEICYWTFRMPSDYASAPVLKLQYAMVSAIANNVQMQCAVAAVTDGDVTDIDASNFDTVNSSAATTVPDSAGYLDEISITLTNADSVAAGDFVTLKVSRNADGGAGVDDATGDLELVAATLTYTTT